MTTAKTKTTRTRTVVREAAKAAIAEDADGSGSWFRGLRECARGEEGVVGIFEGCACELLECKTSDARLGVMRVIDYMFRRSTTFRFLQAQALADAVLPLCCETDPKRPLPLPLASAKRLAKESREMVVRWARDYGDNLAALKIAAGVLKANPSKTLAEKAVAAEGLALTTATAALAELEPLVAKLEVALRDLFSQLDASFEIIVPRVAVREEEEEDKGEEEQHALEDETSIPGIVSGDFEITIDLGNGGDVAVLEGLARETEQQASSVMDAVHEAARTLERRLAPMVESCKLRLATLPVADIAASAPVVAKHRILTAKIEAMTSEIAIRRSQLKDLGLA
jgi:hypothetical protein